MPDIIIPYDGTHASIPAGWTRYTALDGRYPKASASDLEGTGGSATHTHTGSSHTHTYISNSHTHATGTTSGSTDVSRTNAQHQDAPPQEVSTTGHTHSSVTSGAFTSASISTDGFTTGMGDNEYSRYHMVFIKGNVSRPLPADSVVMRNDTNSRPDATHFDDMNNRYMKGAGTGANAGTGTDVTTHTHTQSHNHTMSHTHSNVTSGSGGGNLGGKDIPSSSPGNHTHTVSFTANVENPNNTTAITAGTGTLAYRQLHFWKMNITSFTRIGDIAMSVDSSDPVGWEDQGWDDVYIMGKAEGEALGTGGSNTHTHANLGHTHVGTSHTHPYTLSSTGGSNAYRDGGSSNISFSHTHSGTTGTGTNSTTGSTSAVISTDNAEPLYTKIKYIKKTSDFGGSFIFNLL